MAQIADVDTGTVSPAQVSQISYYVSAVVSLDSTIPVG